MRVVAERDDTGNVRLVPDRRHRMPGRGAWLHPDLDCLEQALRRRAFGRALRTQVQPDSTALAAYLVAIDARDR